MRTEEQLPTTVPKREARRWSPRRWEGCDCFAWMRLLSRNRFRVGFAYLYIAIIVSVVSGFNTMMRLLQEVVFGRRIRQTKLPLSPIFILGHWRTGTTL